MRVKYLVQEYGQPGRARSLIDICPVALTIRPPHLLPVTAHIRLISDIIEQHENKGGMILSLDFEKAFDSLQWDSLFKVLNTMNFGPSFLNWIKTFYANISSCVVNNGYSSEFFSLKGC